MNITDLIKKCAKPHVCPECRGRKIIFDEAMSYEGKAIDCTCPQCNGTGKYLSIPSHLMQINLLLCRAVEAWSNDPSFESYEIQKNGVNPSIRKTAYMHCIGESPGNYLAQAFILILDLCGYLDIEPTEYETSGMFDVPISDNIYVLCSFIFDYDCRNSQTKWVTTLIQNFEAFCNHYNIPLEQHIGARLEYEKAIK